MAVVDNVPGTSTSVPTVALVLVIETKAPAVDPVELAVTVPSI